MIGLNDFNNVTGDAKSVPNFRFEYKHPLCAGRLRLRKPTDGSGSMNHMSEE
jgi:hypothetical protein